MSSLLISQSPQQTLQQWLQHIPCTHTNVEAIHQAHANRHNERCDHEVTVKPNIVNKCDTTVKPCDSMVSFNRQCDLSGSRGAYLSDTAIVDSRRRTTEVTRNIGCRESFVDVICAITGHNEGTWSSVTVSMKHSKVVVIVLDIPYFKNH